QRCEILANITFSKWMGRSWTLQEGALNPFVYFQFADGAVNVLDLLKNPTQPEPTLSIHPARLRRVGLSETTSSLKWAWSCEQRRRRKSYQPRSPHISMPEKMIYEGLYTACTAALHNSGHFAARAYFTAPLHD